MGRKISSIKTVKVTPSITRRTLRVLDGPLPELEQRLRLNAPALLILSSEEIEGRIVEFTANVHSGYEITIEVAASRGRSDTGRRCWKAAILDSNPAGNSHENPA